MKRKALLLVFLILILGTFYSLWSNSIASSTMVFEGLLTDNGNGTYSGTLQMQPGYYYVPGGPGAAIYTNGGFDIFAKEGGSAYYDNVVQGVIGADHDAYGSAGGWGDIYDPDCADDEDYTLVLTSNHWSLIHANAGVPMGGAMDWDNLLATETDTGEYLPETGTPQHPGYAAANGGGPGAWDMDWSWGSEAIPLEYSSYWVKIVNLGGSNYRVTFEPDVEGTIAEQDWYVPSSQLSLGSYMDPHPGALATGYQISAPYQINMLYQAGILDKDITNINTYMFPADENYPADHVDGSWTMNYSDNEDYVFSYDVDGGLPVYTYTDDYPSIVPVYTPGIQWTLTGWGQTILAGDIIEQGGNTYFRVYPEATYRPFAGDLHVNNVEVFEGNIKTEVEGYTFAGTLSSVGTGSVLTCGIPDGLPQFPVYNVNQDTYYLIIQAAIDAADPGDVIQVAAGTYDEQLNINKSISLLGPNHNISAVDGTRVPEAVIEQYIYVYNAAVGVSDVAIAGFEFNETDAWHSIIMIQGQTANVQILNNRFIDIPFQAIYTEAPAGGTNLDMVISGNLISGVSTASHSGVYLIHHTGGSISHNKIEDTAYGGILVNSFGHGMTISDNQIYNVPQQGLQLAGDIADVDVSGNIIDYANTDEESDKGGIRLYASDVTGPVTIADNTISNCFNGIAVKDGKGNLSSAQEAWIQIRDNNLDDNSNSGVYMPAGSTGTLDARENWWGDSAGPTLRTGVGVTDHVLYDPWWGNENMDDLESDIYVVNDTQDTYYTTIQAAIDAANANDILEIPAGTYNLAAMGGNIWEPVSVTKPLTLIGAGSDLTILDATGSTDQCDVVGIRASNVNLEGFTIKNGTYGLRIPGFGYSSSLSGLTLEDLVVTQNRQSGVVMDGAGSITNISFLDCAFDNNGGRGLYTAPGKVVSTISLEDCSACYNTNSGLHFQGTQSSVTITGGNYSYNKGLTSPASYGSGIWFEYTTNATVTGVTAEGNGSVYPSHGIYVRSSSTGVDISGCQISGSLYGIFYLSTSSDASNDATSNVITNCQNGLADYHGKGNTHSLNSISGCGKAVVTGGTLGTLVFTGNIFGNNDIQLHNTSTAGTPLDLAALQSTNTWPGGYFLATPYIYGNGAELVYLTAPKTLLKGNETQTYTVKIHHIENLGGFTIRIKSRKADFASPTGFTLGGDFAGFGMPYLTYTVIPDDDYHIYDVSGGFLGGSPGGAGVTGDDVIAFFFTQTTLTDAIPIEGWSPIDLPPADVVLREPLNAPIPCLGTMGMVIYIDSQAPDPIVWVKCRTLEESNNKIDLAWTNPTDAYKNHIWRLDYDVLAGANPYPTYNPRSFSVPAIPAVGTANGWVLVETVDAAETYVDDSMARGYYYYAVYAEDEAGNVSGNPVSGLFYRESISYWPGDVPSYVDGQVDMDDVNLLSLAWGQVTGGPHWNQYVDIGPSTDSARRSRPCPDGRINIEDMMMFAMNYLNTDYTIYPRDTELQEPPAVTIAADANYSSDQLTVTLRLGDNAGAVRGLSLPLAFGSGLELQSVTAGDIWPEDSILLHTNADNVVEVSASVMGGNATLPGNGCVATLVFDIVGEDRAISLNGLVARDVDNRDIVVTEVPGTVSNDDLINQIPAENFLGRNYPNPFTGSTTLNYGLKEAGSVRILIYNNRGQLVRSLVNDAKAAGSYRAVWDGKDSRGLLVSSGVYFIRMEAAGYVKTNKALLIK